MSPLAWHHVDVFSPRPYSGNSLAVCADARHLSDVQMLAIARELRHFESIFLAPSTDSRSWRARIFDLAGELDFAGHPLLGAAAVLHALHREAGRAEWRFTLNAKAVPVTTMRTAGGYTALLDQGRPEFLGELPAGRRGELVAALGLEASDAAADVPLQVVSTGLRYLILPITQGLERARIVRRDFDALLASIGAQYVYVLDVNALEGRHWNNDGLLEDVATGSAAGTVGAYAVRHGLVDPGQEFILRQGRFAGRPSEMRVTCEGSRAHIERVLVGGDVAPVGSGTLEVLP